MPRRVTDSLPREKIRKELKTIIEHSRVFSRELHEILEKYGVDIAGERKATVEVLKIVMQKWIIEIIHVFFIEGRMRFNDIKRNLRGISSRTLSSKLRLLEDSGFVERMIVSKRPLIAEYGLTNKGKIFAELSAPIILYLKLEGISAE
jgi:DNA-binding HxlR family transcriptional regulator